jgi:signal transduction histidine kinase
VKGLSSNLLIILSLIWAATILAIGMWWGYFIVTLSKNELLKGQMGGVNVQRMIQWEGSLFLIMLLLISGTLLFFYIRNQKKTKNLQTFFASLTHELKTPLASIKLQTEVIAETISNFSFGPDDSGFKSKLGTLSDRLIEDTNNLEMEMEKILHLSRVERGGNLNPVPLNLFEFLNSSTMFLPQGVELQIDDQTAPHTVLADHFALKLIIRNLVENSIIHAKRSNISITLSEADDTTLLTYEGGGHFHGDIKKLGTLFYKYNSPKGSGIGLYLSKQLMVKMGGRLDIDHHPKLTFFLRFNKS